MMRIIRSLHEMQTYALRRRAQGRRIGFAPTMGCLHEGHLSLMRAARKDCDDVVVSIFVNPMQFGPQEDLASYPRTLAADLAQLMDIPVDVAFVPRAADLYPEGYTSTVQVSGLTEHLCGAARPVHFRGVTTVVCKLFNLVQPQRAYFGEKDYQQLQVVRRMTADLNLAVEIIGAPIVREDDGVAMSSRNRYLSVEERRAATSLHRGLEAAAEAAGKGERNAARLRDIVITSIEAEPLLSIDYVSVCDASGLEPVCSLEAPTLIALAVYAGKARLIDNMVLLPTPHLAAQQAPIG